VSSRRILFFTVASILVLAFVSHYVPINHSDESQQSNENNDATGDLNRLSDQPAPTAASAPHVEAVPASGVTPAPSLSSEEKSKLELFRTVVKTGKDNDPRVDTELKNLSPALKAALKNEYESLPKEHRNGRGFVAFLIGRSLTEPADVEFLEKVVTEEPCLSFKDCSVKGAMYEEAEEHSTQVSLNYPQIVATRMLKQNLTKAPPELRGRISEAVSASPY
jgi:hypothetical protein